MHGHEEASRHVAGSSIVDIANQIFIAKRAIYGYMTREWKRQI